MIPVTLAYIILLLLIGIQQNNITILVFTFSYFIWMLILQPYLNNNSALELISIAVVILVGMVLNKINIVEKFADSDIPSRPCKVYFTNNVTACDKGDFQLSDIEFNQILEKAKQEANSYRSLNPQTFKSNQNTLANPEVKLYENANYQGKEWILGKGDYPWIPNNGITNDAISSIKVEKDTRVYLYEHSNYTGRVLILDGPVYLTELLSKKFNDITSSIKVTYHPLAYYNYLLKIRSERRSLNSICKQEFPGWLEVASHPMKIPNELYNRGNLRDWGFCYKPLYDVNSKEIYNVESVASKFEEYRTNFGKHKLVEPDEAYVPTPENNNLPYNLTKPEYIRIFFKNFSPDPPATCENPVVDYLPNYPSLSSQYGFEFGINSPSINKYTISSFNIIQTSSAINGYQFMYDGTYNVPNYNTLVSLLFDYRREGTRIILVPKPDTSVNNQYFAYKFYIDICGKLTNKGAPEKVTYSFANKINSISEKNKVVYEGNYPFNVTEPKSGINITNYDPVKINEQNIKLQSIIQENLGKIEIENSKINLLAEDVPDRQEGLVRQIYKLPQDFKIKNTEEMDALESNLEIIRDSNKIEYDTFTHGIWQYHYDLPVRPYGNVNYGTYQTYNGFLRIKTPGEYQFRFLLFDSATWSGIENAQVPLRYSIDFMINGQVMSHLYYCSKYDECLNTQSSKTCDRNALCRFIPSWYQHADRRNQSHHIIGSIKITEPINSIKIRIVTNANLNESPYCRLMYKRVNDPQPNYFRLIRYVWNNQWKRYDDDIIFYKKSDYTPETRTKFLLEKDNFQMTDRVNLNNQMIQGVREKELQVMQTVTNSLIGQDASWLNAVNIQKYLSENNRLYMFFVSTRTAPVLPDKEELLKIKEFNNNLKK